MASIRSIGMAKAAADTRRSQSISLSQSIDYVAVRHEDAAGIVFAATLPSIDNGHMVQDHVPSAATFIFQATPPIISTTF